MEASPTMFSSLDPGAGKRRRPAWLPALAALALAFLTFQLGQWQMGRAAEKQQRLDAFAAAAEAPARALAGVEGAFPEYVRVGVEGHYEAAHQVFIDNRVRQGRAGYHVVTPLVHEGGVVLVNRGWLPAPGERGQTLLAPPPPGRQVLEGWLVPARSRYLELDGQTQSGPVWQNLDLDRYRREYRADLPDRLLLQQSAAADGLARDWAPGGPGPERHLGYALQWYSLTGLSLGLYAYFGIWRRIHGSS